MPRSPLRLRTAFEIAKSWKSADTAVEGHHVLVSDTAAPIAKLVFALRARDDAPQAEIGGGSNLVLVLYRSVAAGGGW
jgi:hypothetical protein